MEPAFTIAQAARACAVNRRTIRRHREAGDFPGAFKDDEGIWRIPVVDLEGAGLNPYLAGRLDEPPEATMLDRLKGEITVLRERLKSAEAIAREREQRIQDLRLVLRLLPVTGATRAGQLVPPAGPLPAGATRPSVPSRVIVPGTGSEIRTGPAAPVRTSRVSGLTATRTGVRSETAEEDALIWLPSVEPVARPDKTEGEPVAEGTDDSLWRPGATREEDQTPPPFPDAGPAVDRGLVPAFPEPARGSRLSWLPWRRNRS